MQRPSNRAAVTFAEQAAAGRERAQEVGVPAVPQTVLGEGRARRGAADQLRHRGRVIGSPFESRD